MSVVLNTLRALRFHNRNVTGLESLKPAEWPDLLAMTDRERLTLALGLRCRDSLPSAVAERIHRNLEQNAERHSCLITAYREIADALRASGIEFLVLKGLTHGAYYAEEAYHRPQYDFDLYCPQHYSADAMRAIESLGYVPFLRGESGTTDHFPVMIRKNGWKWRGDYFDPAMPFSVELHFRFWDERTERFQAGDGERFWPGRVESRVSGLYLPSLTAADGLTYATWHLMRHLLRGDLRLYHVYELAHFLEQSSGDDAFWREWESRDPAGSRQTEAIAFRLAKEWFHCEMHATARAAVDRLPNPVKRWFELFAMSPAQAIERPNKNELWLHWCLVNNAGHRWEIAMRRLFPISRERVVADAHVAPENVTFGLRARRMAIETQFLANRAFHHMRVLPPAIGSGMRWWLAQPRSQ
jgi:hypothetical protein